MHACTEGNRLFVSSLLSHDADFNAEDEDKCNCLHMAAREGHTHVVQDLIDAGAKVDSLDIGQWTPLIWACYKGQTAVVDTLITGGADVNARGSHQVILVYSIFWVKNDVNVIFF